MPGYAPRKGDFIALDFDAGALVTGFVMLDEVWPSWTPDCIEGHGIMRRSSLLRLEDLPNVGPAIAATLRRVDVRKPSDLAGRDPYALFDELAASTGRRYDPCLLDVFIAATRFMNGGPAKPWWAYTKERKARLDKTRRSGAATATRGR